MKKILSILLVLVMCVSLFAACAGNNTTTGNNVTSGDATSGDGTSTPPEDPTGPSVEPTDSPDDPTDPPTTDPVVNENLARAKEYLQSMYKDARDTETAIDFTRVSVVSISKDTFKITWTIEVTSGDGACLSIEEGETMTTIKVAKNYSGAIVEYTLIGTISDENGNTETVSFNHTVPMSKQVAELADGTYVISANGLSMAAMAESYNYGYPTGNAVTDTYFTALDIVTITNVGDYLTIQDAYGRYLYLKGTYNSFNLDKTMPESGHLFELQVNTDGSFALVNVAMQKTLAYSTSYASWGCYATLTDDHNSKLTITKVDPANASVPDEWGVCGTFTNWGNDGDGYRVDISMVASDEENVLISSEYIELKVGDEFKIRNHGKWDENYPSENYKVTVEGKYYVLFNTETHEISLKEYVAPDVKTDWQPIVEAPVADTAYKFGMNQVTLGKTLYFNGEISGENFLGTTENVDEAVDMYAEVVDGGYKLYFVKDGTKTYIALKTYQNSKGYDTAGVKLVTDAAEAPVFTYNAELYIFVTPYLDTEYYLGSYKEFATISVSKTSFIDSSNAGTSQFQARFYSLQEVVDKPDPEPPTPSGELTVVEQPEVGVAYKFGLYHGGLDATVYFNGLNYESKGTSYPGYLAFTEDKAEAVDVYLEAVEGAEGHYRMYFLREGEKVYIRTYPRDGDTTKGTMELTTTVPEEDYTYDAEYKTLIYTSTTGEKFYLGSSGTYKSISVSADSYISSATNYPAHFYAESAGGETGDEDIKTILDKAFALEDGEFMTGSFTLTGVITKVETMWGGSAYKVTIQVENDGREILCYKLKGDNVKELQVGDTVTVTSEEFKNYAGTIELNGCTLVSFEYGKDHVFVERVVKPALTEEGNTLIFNVGGWAEENGWTEGSRYYQLEIKAGLSVIINATAVGGYGVNSGKYYPSADGNDTWRLYQNENVTFTLTSDKKIKTIKVTFSGKKDVDRLLFNGQLYESGAVIEVNDTTFTFGVSNIGGEGLENYTSAHVRIEEIEIVYADEGGDTPACLFTEEQQGTYFNNGMGGYTLVINADGTVDYTVEGTTETGLTVTEAEGVYSFTFGEETVKFDFDRGFLHIIAENSYDDIYLFKPNVSSFTEEQQGKYTGEIGYEWDGVFEAWYLANMTLNANGTVDFTLSLPKYDENYENIGWDDPYLNMAAVGVYEYDGKYYFYVETEMFGYIYTDFVQFYFNEDGTITMNYMIYPGYWEEDLFYNAQMSKDEGGSDTPVQEEVSYTANMGDFTLTWDGTFVDYVNDSEWVYVYGQMPTEENGVYTFSYNRGYTTVTFYVNEEGNIVLTDSDLGTYTFYKNGVGDDHIQNGTEGGDEGGDTPAGDAATFTEEQQGTYEGEFMIVGGFTVKINADNTVTFINPNSGYDVTDYATVDNGVYTLVLSASAGEYVSFTIEGDTLTVTDFYYWWNNFTGTATKQAGGEEGGELPGEAATFTEDQQGTYAYEDYGYKLVINADNTVDYTVNEVTETGLAVTMSDGTYYFAFGGEVLSFNFDRSFAHLLDDDLWLLKASVKSFTEAQQGKYFGEIGYGWDGEFYPTFSGDLTVNADGTVDFALGLPVYDESYENIVDWEVARSWKGLGVTEYDGKYYFLVTIDSVTYVEFAYNEDGTISMNYMIDPWFEWDVFYTATLTRESAVEPDEPTKVEFTEDQQGTYTNKNNAYGMDTTLTINADGTIDLVDEAMGWSAKAELVTVQDGVYYFCYLDNLEACEGSFWFVDGTVYVYLETIDFFAMKAGNATFTEAQVGTYEGVEDTYDDTSFVLTIHADGTITFKYITTGYWEMTAGCENVAVYENNGKYFFQYEDAQGVIVTCFSFNEDGTIALGDTLVDDGSAINTSTLTKKAEKPACEHTETEVKDAVEATATEPGYTGDTYCKDCGEKLEEGTVIPATATKVESFTEAQQGTYTWADDENAVSLTVNADGTIDFTAITEEGIENHTDVAVLRTVEGGYLFAVEGNYIELTFGNGYIIAGETILIDENLTEQVIYFPEDGKLVTGEVYTYPGKTVKDELVLSTDPAAALKLYVVENADGTVTFMTADCRFLYCDGTDVKLVDEEGEFTLFVLEKAENGYYIKCNTANYNGNAQYLEVYSGYLTCFSFNTEKPNLYTFKMIDAEDMIFTAEQIGKYTFSAWGELYELTINADGTVDFTYAEEGGDVLASVTGALVTNNGKGMYSFEFEEEVYTFCFSHGFACVEEMPFIKTVAADFDEVLQGKYTGTDEEMGFAYELTVNANGTIDFKWFTEVMDFANVTNLGVSEYDGKYYMLVDSIEGSQYAAFYFNEDGTLALDFFLDTYDYENDGIAEEWIAIYPTTLTKSNEVIATLDFSNVANRVSQNTESQVWESNGIKVTNEKSESKSDVADYSNPVRFYAKSSVTIAYTGMTKIVINCNTAKYAKALAESIGTLEGVTVSVSDAVVTITFDEAVNSFKIDALTAQVRVDSITVYA